MTYLRLAAGSPPDSSLSLFPPDDSPLLLLRLAGLLEGLSEDLEEMLFEVIQQYKYSCNMS